MPGNYTSTFALNLSISEAEDAAAGGAVEIDTVSMSLDVTTGPVESEEDGMALQVGGDATAVGQDTLATAGVAAIVAGDGAVQTAHGAAAFYAEGEGQGAFASAVSYGEIYGAADFGFTLNYAFSSTSQEVDGSAEWSAAAITEVFALDLDGLPMGGGAATAPAAPEPPPDPELAAFPLSEAGWDDCGCGSSGGWDLELDGNLAVFDVVVAAVGDNSFAQADVQAFTVEDQLSTVTVVVTAAIV